MLRVTAQTLFLFYLVVDVIDNPVDLVSGKHDAQKSFLIFASIMREQYQDALRRAPWTLAAFQHIADITGICEESSLWQESSSSCP